MKILLLILTIISIIVSLGTFIWLKKSLGKAVGKEEGDVKDILKKSDVITKPCYEACHYIKTNVKNLVGKYFKL